MRSIRHPVLCVSVVLTVVMSVTLVLGASTPALAQTWETIGNYHSSKCLDDTNGSSANGNQQQIWGCGYNSHQEWKFYTGIDGTYQIENDVSLKCLDMWGGSSANGTKIAIYSCNSSDDAQLWYLYPTDISGWHVFQNRASGTCMTVRDDSGSNGAQVWGWSCATAESDHSFFWEPHSSLV
jgi:Ricin-type beta-trefoil lectin domain